MAKQNNNEDEQQDDNINEDNFGLPDLEYKPLASGEGASQQPQEEQPEQQPESQEEEPLQPEESEYLVEEVEYEQPAQPIAPPPSATYQEVEKSNAPVIIGIIVALVVVIGAALAYFYVYKPAADEKVRQEQLARAEAKRKEEEARLKAQREEEARRQQQAAQQTPPPPAQGTIETLSARTGRYYVVIASAVDDDLIMDYAKQLSDKGTSTKVIPPFGKWKYYRLTIGDFDSYNAAQASADEAKADYSEGTWVIKY